MAWQPHSMMWPARLPWAQPVVVVGAPVELVHQGAQRHGAVDATAGDHDLRALIQGLLHRQGAQVGVGGQQPVRQRRSALQFGNALAAQGADQRHHVVALDHRDPDRDALLRGQRGNRPGAGLGIHAAGVADDADALGNDVAQHGLHRHGDEVGRVAQLGVLAACRGQDRHGELGQVVEHQIVDRAVRDQLRRANAAVAPEARGPAYPHRAGHQRPFHCGLRRCWTLLAFLRILFGQGGQPQNGAWLLNQQLRGRGFAQWGSPGWKPLYTPVHDRAYVTCAAAGLSYSADEALQLGCKTYIGPRPAFMPETAPRIERQSAPEGPHVRVLGQWTASQFARPGLLGELQAELAGIAERGAWDLSEAEQLDHVGAQLLWDHWGRTVARAAGAATLAARGPGARGPLCDAAAQAQEGQPAAQLPGPGCVRVERRRPPEVLRAADRAARAEPGAAGARPA